ncbi:MAG: hypothetical protein LUH10_00150, partial [Tannerellaceae bacterium]|nr:hypothetical protein [Tannerellaceae bacterium]
MATIQSLKQIFEWFKKGKYPTEEHFADTFFSFWHKTEDKLPIEAVEDLNTQLNSKYDKAEGRKLEERMSGAENHLNEHDTHLHEVDDTLTAYHSALEEHANRLSKHDGELDDQGVRLDGHDKILDEHDTRLDEHTEWLKSHDDGIETINAALIVHQETLNEQAGKLDGHEEWLDNHETLVNMHTDQLEKHDEHLKEHDETFAVHTTELKRLDGHDSDIEEICTTLDEHTTTLDEYGVTLGEHTDELANHEGRTGILENKAEVHENMLNEHTNELSDHADELLNHTDKISTLETAVDNNTRDISVHNQNLVAHGDTLKEHEDLLKKHTDRLDEIQSENLVAMDATLQNHGTRIGTNETDIQSLKDSRDTHNGRLNTIEQVHIPTLKETDEHQELVLVYHEDRINNTEQTIATIWEQNLDGRLTTAEDIATNHAKILAEHSIELSAHTDTLEEHADILEKYDGRITANEKNISILQGQNLNSRLTNAEGTISEHTTRITNNEKDIQNLQKTDSDIQEYLNNIDWDDLGGIKETVSSGSGNALTDLSVSSDGKILTYTKGSSYLLSTGTAASATKLATARTIGLSGVTATAQSFNGEANIT